MTKSYILSALTLCLLQSVQASAASNEIAARTHHLHLERTHLSYPRTKKHHKHDNNKNSTITIGAASFGQVFLTNLKVGNQIFSVVLDTGSSDTWLVDSKFNCFDVTTHHSVPQSQCAFGPLYTQSPSFKTIPNRLFNITYGDGESLIGNLATEHVTLAGFTVQNQTIGTVTHASWYGDGISSGLLGLGLFNNTHAFALSNATANLTTPANIPYTPLFYSMFQQHLTEPMFSMALHRKSNSTGNYGGVLTIGGLPDVPYDKHFATVPIQKKYGETKYHYYTFAIDDIIYQNSTTTAASNSTKRPVQMFVDSGTPSIELPTAHANAYNALFQPSAVMDENLGAYVTTCTAKIPKLGIKIGGRVFTVDAADLLVPVVEQVGNCTTGIGDSGEDEFGTLGDVFLTNVVAVHDLGRMEMRFAGRKY